MMSSRSRLFVGSVLCSLLIPFVAGATSLRSIVDVSAPTVTRANFLSWSVTALGLARGSGDCSLPYVRVPRGMRATLCLAQENGVLPVFGTGKVYPLGKQITRGEALIVLTLLTGRNEEEDVSSFKDIRTDDERSAVMNAVALKWMLPSRAASFGIQKPLTGVEALSVLQAVSDQSPDRPQEITISLGGGGSGVLPKQELMDAVWEIIQRDYLRSDKVDDEEASYKAIEGLVDSLDDPYTSFFRPVSAENFQSQIKGEISGIGAQIEEKDGVITVVTPIPGSPAERAGIVSGDQILSANGNDLTGIGVDKAVQFIRGERGTTVELKIRRGTSEMTLIVLRDLISIPEIQVTWQGDIAVVQLVQFGETTQKQIRSVFSDIDKKNPRGIILDLRNNGGGLLSAADIVASNFLPRGTVVAKVRSKSETTTELTEGEPTVRSSTRLVVLVNKGSASASEIVAGALQDWKRATIVGIQTFGKGTVQEVISFHSGEALKVTVAEWLTPQDRTIEGIGVKPDIVVDTEDRDAQLKRALDILR